MKKFIVTLLLLTIIMMPIADACVGPGAPCVTIQVTNGNQKPPRCSS